ncbi:MAG: DUF134 domain-containing protein [Bacteroidetes bacterium]|nr:DUF134 domain-containing protein [Bacteroidota bacterium]MBL7103493.1 DUF134 domain-containing protein [Bacteroidales bacterium]
MPRPKNERIVHQPPLFSEFKPSGVAGRLLNKTLLSLDEYEAFRLADHIGLSHAEAAEEMEISRSTFTRLIEQARKKIAELIINGNVLLIKGGNIHFRKNIIRCMDCGYMFDMSIESSFINCPECHSKNLLNLAGGFGHGKCCTDRNFNHIKKERR